MPGSAGRTVIIVEDDISLCQALERILRLGGYVPRMFCSAEACLEDPRTADAACMILDVQLPGMNGFALHERLTARGAARPVIFITAFDESEARTQVEQLAGAAFLPKPFAGRVLLDAVRRAVEA